MTDCTQQVHTTQENAVLSRHDQYRGHLRHRRRFNELLIHHKRQRTIRSGCPSEKFVNVLCPRGVVDTDFMNVGKKYISAHNVVAKVHLGNMVDLRKFSGKRHNAYVPSQFEACVTKVTENLPTTGLLFRTARSVAVGPRSVEQTYKDMHRMRLELAADGKRTTFSDFKVVNMVYNTQIDTDTGIDIAGIYRDHMAYATWIPSKFPGLGLYVPELGVKLRIFDTKNVIIMGPVDPSDYPIILEFVRRLAEKYKDYSVPASHKRYKYRQDRLRSVCSDIALSMESSTHV